mmetsp:Transcript_29031/g.94595  ORF Transcript_29031/g.94595 Transcript_29031/m.94595 type:complete len:162 (-) Transcript_29031:563-1048(-)|eukprot:CAMPEP_0196774794 /NCGR_PEP_ID=MMETSP1104-20130614/3627_1 /TAXON_ID=33652 /ORGANISM="Cafeteria sp., Strain Caron Lab Isolate" /LENGTH=161 /DNA_ID=CAMNT_0042144957 /DNA_START=70 /DNA_END=555 /DNA_ORIENTATION=+
MDEELSLYRSDEPYAAPTVDDYVGTGPHEFEAVVAPRRRRLRKSVKIILAVLAVAAVAAVVAVLVTHTGKKDKDDSAGASSMYAELSTATCDYTSYATDSQVAAQGYARCVGQQQLAVSSATMCSCTKQFMVALYDKYSDCYGVSDAKNQLQSSMAAMGCA